MRARLFVSQERVMVAHRDRSSLLKHALQGGHDGFGLKLLHEVIPKFVQRNLVRMQYIRIPR
jgi:hypothetical protein